MAEKIEKTFHSITLPGQDTARVPLTAAEFSISTAYNVRDYCTYRGILYRCTTAHAAGVWNDEHFTPTDVDAEFDRKLDIPASQASAPANPRVGDLWIDNDENSPIYNVDASPTLNSTNAVQSGGTKVALNSLDSRKMEHGVITGDFSESVDYRIGDLVFYVTTANGITTRTLYRCTTDHNSTDWNTAHFTETTLEVELQKIRESEADTDMIGDLFGTKTTYAIGDYCIYNDNLYRCIQAVDNTGVTTPAFDPDDWIQVALANDVHDLNSAFNTIISYDNENLIVFSAETFVKRSTSADPTSITYNDNGMTVTHGSVNANYGIKMSTVQGVSYTIQFDMITGTSNAVMIVDGASYSTAAIQTITPTGTHYEATFIARSATTTLWISFSYSVATITIANSYLYETGKAPWNPTGINPDMFPDDVAMIGEIVDKSHNILALSDDTLKETGDYHITSITYDGDSCVITKPQVNVRFGFTFRPLVGQEYNVSFAASNAYIDNIKVIPGTKYAADNSVLDLTLTEANTVSGVFTTTTDEYTIWMRSTYQMGNLTLSSFIVRTTDESSNIKKSKIPVLENYQVPKLGELVHNFAITAKHVFIINGIDGFWLYNNGLCKCDVPAYGYGLRQNPRSPNVMQYDEAIPNKIKAVGNVVANGVLNKTIIAYIPQNNTEIGRGSLTIKCATKPSNPATIKNVLFVGDSLVAGNVFPKSFKDQLSDNGITNIALIGRKTDPSDNMVHYEATGGYAWPDYAQNPNDSNVPIPIAPGHSNPFWINGALDIKAYCDTYCGGEYPDYVICNLSWNMFVNSSYSQYVSQSNYAENVKSLIVAFITAVRVCSPNAKIILNGMHHGCEGKLSIYPSLTYTNGAEQIADVYMDIVNNPTYSSFVEYCDIAPYFDAETGMQIATRTVNQFSEETETYVTDYIHPSAVGYKMHALADMECFLYMLANET